MRERLKKGGSGWALGMAAALVVLMALGAYAGGYFALGTDELVIAPLQKIGEPPREYIRARAFDHHWQARLFAPAAQVESLILGEPVEVATHAGRRLP